MTAPRSVPAVALQSSSDCCWVCLGGRRVLARPVPSGECPEPVATPVACPHCVGSADLAALIGSLR